MLLSKLIHANLVSRVSSSCIAWPGRLQSHYHMNYFHGCLGNVLGQKWRKNRLDNTGNMLNR